ncbi:MAG: hypothetical protein O3A46_03815 [Candidatus Poribacteria bacterium]|nr:hypothetical protein [Candidatus Poribacteria bacterium]
MTQTSNLRESLTELHVLQTIDEEINRLTEARRELVRRAKAADLELKKHQATLDAKKKAHTDAQVAHRTKSVQLTADQEKLKTHEDRLSKASDASEYTALQKQIETSTRLIGEAEEAAIELMLAIDETKEALDAVTVTFQAFENDYKAIRRDLADQAKEIDGELKQCNAARNAQAKIVNAEWTKNYDQWRERRQITLVSMVQTHVARERSGKVITFNCGECHMTIPTQMMAEAREFAKTHRCPSCHRVLLATDVDAESDE